VLTASLAPTRAGLAAGWQRLRFTWRTLVQSAAAAAVAYWIAADVLGHEQAFFAPIAAVVIIGVSQGQRLRRAAELVVGVSIGILLGELLIAVIGTGLWQLALAVFAAMAAAVALGGGPVVIVQSASSVVLIATLAPPGDETIVALTRFEDALIGGLVGLASAALLLPMNPVRLAGRVTQPLLTELDAVLRDIAAALEAGSRPAAAAALQRARATSRLAEQMHLELAASREIARIAPVRWRSRGQLLGYVEAEPHLDHAARNTRVLARQALASLRLDLTRPPELPAIVREAGAAVAALGEALASDEEDDHAAARAAALRLASSVSDVLDPSWGLSVQVVLAQGRAIAADLLLADGVPDDDIVRVLPDLPHRR
jgi:uncharacterized membrane protein YgaE (UPF0421/DUF939 family)